MIHQKVDVKWVLGIARRFEVTAFRRAIRAFPTRPSRGLPMPIYRESNGASPDLRTQIAIGKPRSTSFLTSGLAERPL